MSELTFIQSLLRRVTAKIAYDVGFHSAHTTAIDTLAEVLRTYLIQLCSITKDFSELADREQPGIEDLETACKYLGIDFGQLKDYIVNVDSAPLEPQVPFFPIQSKPNRVSDYHDDAIEVEMDEQNSSGEIEKPEWYEDWMPTLNIEKHCRIVAEKIRTNEAELARIKAEQEAAIDNEAQEEAKANENDKEKDKDKENKVVNGEDVIMKDQTHDNTKESKNKEVKETENDLDLLNDGEPSKMIIDDDEEIDGKKDENTSSKVVFRFPTNSALEEAEASKKIENDNLTNNESDSVNRRSMIEKFINSKTFQQFRAALTDKVVSFDDKLTESDSNRLQNNYISREATPEPVEEKPADDSAPNGKKPRKKKRDLFGEFANKKQPRKASVIKKDSDGAITASLPGISNNTIGNTVGTSPFGLKFNLNFSSINTDLQQQQQSQQPQQQQQQQPQQQQQQQLTQNLSTFSAMAKQVMENSLNNQPSSLPLASTFFGANQALQSLFPQTPLLNSIIPPTTGIDGTPPPRQKRKYTKRAQATPKPVKIPKLTKKRSLQQENLNITKMFDDASATGLPSLDGIGSSNFGEGDASKQSDNMFIDPAVLAADDSSFGLGTSKGKKPRKTKTNKSGSTILSKDDQPKPETKKGRPKLVSNKIKSQEVVESSDESSNSDGAPEGEQFDTIMKKNLLSSLGIESSITSQDLFQSDSKISTLNESFESKDSKNDKESDISLQNDNNDRKRKHSISSVEEGEALSDNDKIFNKSFDNIKNDNDKHHDDESVADSSKSRDEKKKEKHKKKKKNKDKDKSRDDKDKHRKHKKSKKEKHRDRDDKKELKFSFKFGSEQRDSPVLESAREDSTLDISSDHERKKSKDKKKDKKDKEKKQQQQHQQPEQQYKTEHSPTPEPMPSIKFIRTEKTKKSSLTNDERSSKNRKLLISFDTSSDIDSYSAQSSTSAVTPTASTSGLSSSKSKDKTEKYRHEKNQNEKNQNEKNQNEKNQNEKNQQEKNQHEKNQNEKNQNEKNQNEKNQNENIINEKSNEKIIPKLKMKDVIQHDDKKKSKQNANIDGSMDLLFKPDTKEKKKKEKQQNTIKIDSLPQVSASPSRSTIPQSSQISSLPSSSQAYSSTNDKISKKDQDKSCTIIRETISTKDEKVYLCPKCKYPDDGSPMIGCDKCEEWYHYACVGIVNDPDSNDQWFCSSCISNKKTKTKSKDHLLSSSSSSKKSSSKNSVAITPLSINTDLFLSHNSGNAATVSGDSGPSRSHVPDVTISPQFKPTITPKKSKKKSKKSQGINLCVCPLCGKNVPDNISEIKCERCDQLYHSNCLCLHPDDKPDDWLCEHCTKVDQFLHPNKPLSKTDQKFLAAQANSKKKNSLETSSQEDSRCGTCKLGGDDDQDRNWIACDECSTWYHYECQGVVKEPPEDAKWHCKKCIQKQKSLLKNLKKLM